MKRSGFTWWKWLVSGAGLLLIAAVLWPVFHDPPYPRTNHCMMNLKQIGLALAQYSQDSNARLPLVVGSQVSTKTTAYGWADAIYPYLKNTQIFQCPTEGSDGSKTTPIERGHTDFWLNANLSGLNSGKVKSPMTTISSGEGNDGGDLTDARYNLFALPAAWLNDENSPPYRHRKAANYLFLDGHVKRISPDKITAGAVTFAPK